MEFALFQKDYQYSNEPIQDLSGVRFSIAIISYEQCHGSNRQIVKTWDNLRFQQLQKYQWFFRRIAALFQLQHPGKIFYFSYLRTVIATKEQSELKTLQNKITNLKGRITKDRNNLQQARKNWVSLFPIEDDPQYQKAMQIIQGKEDRLKALEFQMQT